jgi:protoporphyrinogen oxidase
MTPDGASAPGESWLPSESGAGNVAILGAGFAGLSAGSRLARGGVPVTLIEKDHTVGGLARTIERNGFSFDLGGHRFHTGNSQVEALFREALGGDVLEVARSSKILRNGRYFDYPGQPFDAIRGCGLGTTASIIFN